MPKGLIEVEFQKGRHGCCTPFLRSKKLRKTMMVEWGEGAIYNYREFERQFYDNAMMAELQAIWDRYLPQCGRRAIFMPWVISGGMYYVPQEAGEEAVAVVHRYFTEAWQAINEEQELV